MVHIQPAHTSSMKKDGTQWYQMWKRQNGHRPSCMSQARLIRSFLGYIFCMLGTHNWLWVCFLATKPRKQIATKSLFWVHMQQRLLRFKLIWVTWQLTCMDHWFLHVELRIVLILSAHAMMTTTSTLASSKFMHIALLNHFCSLMVGSIAGLYAICRTSRMSIFNC